MTPDPLVPGRPRLVWAGKGLPEPGPPPPARPVELYPGAEAERDAAEGGLLFHGDNLEVLHHLLEHGYRGRVKLVYIDPPFDSGADYARRILPRGDGKWLGEQTQYSDVWADDRYLQFIYERLWPLRELLAEDGALYLHCNSARSHHLRALLDEVFGAEQFRNQIVVRRIRKNIRERERVPRLNDACDFVFFYARGPAHRVAPPQKKQPRPERWHAFDAPNVRANLEYPLFGHRPPPGRHWLRTEAEARQMVRRGDLRAHPRTGRPEYRIPASTHVLRDSLWDDVTAYAFRTGYPTEKKEELLEIILGMSSEPGDLVLDCFLGSGTTAAVSQRMGRRWIGADASASAVGTAARRLAEGHGTGFAVWRVGEPPPVAEVGSGPRARISAHRQGEELCVRVVDFASPAVVSRQKDDGANGDWRSAVEAVLIDPDWNGETFRVALCDAPARRGESVRGSYLLPAPPPGARVAVRVVDVLGGEATATIPIRDAP